MAHSNSRWSNPLPPTTSFPTHPFSLRFTHNNPLLRPLPTQTYPHIISLRTTTIHPHSYPDSNIRTHMGAYTYSDQIHTFSCVIRPCYHYHAHVACRCSRGEAAG